MKENVWRKIPFQTHKNRRDQKLERVNRFFTKTPKSKICFSILVHNERELVKELIDNVRHFCPNSTFVLFNGGDDPSLCKDLGVPVCPSSRKLSRGYTTIYFLETMEWIEELGIDYDYFINIDSDALFIKDGYEEMVAEQMKDSDYMAVRLRIPEENWYIGNQLKKDIERWRELFCIDPFYGVFNVGQVMKRPLVKALLESKRKEKLKKALLETTSFGSDEIFFVNMAHELGFRLKNYPYESDLKINRFRPYFQLGEIINCLNNREFSGLCHPIYRHKNDQSRKLIKHLVNNCTIEKYRNRDYPWYESDQTNYALSIPINSKFGNVELIVRTGNSLTHYWEHRETKTWNRTRTFAEGVTGTPIFYGNSPGKFEVVSKLEKGGIGYWWRDNTIRSHPWYGPSFITQEDVEPIMLDQLKDGQKVLVCKTNEKLIFWVGSNEEEWIKEPPLP